MNTYKILFVEDDINLGYILKEYISLHGFSVVWAKNGVEGLSYARRETFHLAILDVTMPRMDGFELAQAIRQSHDLPIIFLTSKSLLVDKLKAFKLGADDYIVKPVAEEELIARVNAIVKRRYVVNGEATGESRYTIGKYVFDFYIRKLTIDGEEIFITAKEADLLRMLCMHQGTVLDRKEALGKLWTTVDYFTRRNMDVFITRLRKHLARDRDIQIINIHGKGFMLKVQRSA